MHIDDISPIETSLAIALWGPNAFEVMSRPHMARWLENVNSMQAPIHVRSVVAIAPESLDRIPHIPRKRLSGEIAGMFFHNAVKPIYESDMVL